MKKISKWTSLLLAAVMLLAILAGCSSSTDGSNSGSANAGTPAGPSSGAEVKDTLRVAMTSEPPSLSIYDHSSLLSVLMNVQMYNGLTRIDYTTLEPVCDLADRKSVV